MNPTCPMCAARISECPTNEHGFPLADQVFNVGNAAADSMGHAMYVTPTGRIALCIAKRLAAVSLGRRGGKASAANITEAKRAASRANGAKGGRPKKAKG